MAGDQLIKCSECGTIFVWTAGEQAAGTKPAMCAACRRLAPAPGRRRGVVKWFSRAKGYGFITPVEGDGGFRPQIGVGGGAAVAPAQDNWWNSRWATARAAPRPSRSLCWRLRPV